MTQYERILRYLDDFGSITPMEAFQDLGITKLATRISELKSRGYAFNGTMVCSKNRYGQDCWYMRYTKAV